MSAKNTYAARQMWLHTNLKIFNMGKINFNNYTKNYSFPPVRIFIVCMLYVAQCKIFTEICLYYRTFNILLILIQINIAWVLHSIKFNN